MSKNIKELMENYDNQTNTTIENEEAKAYCQGTDDQFECCQLCTALTCVSCCEAMCNG